MFKNVLSFLTSLFFLFVFSGCTNNSLTPLSNAKNSNYLGTAQILIAVDGTDDRKIDLMKKTGA